MLPALQSLYGARRLHFKCPCSHWVIPTCSYKKSPHHTEKQGEADERMKEQGSSLSNPFDVKGRCYSLGTCRDRKIRTEDNKKTIHYVEKLTVVADSDLYSTFLCINRTEYVLRNISYKTVFLFITAQTFSTHVCTSFFGSYRCINYFSSRTNSYFPSKTLKNLK